MDADASAAALPPSSGPSAPGSASGNKPAKLAAAPPMDSKVWSAFLHNFTQVQYLLDHNRLLLHQINLNQESKIPESLTRNILLTRELNDNITKVVELYSKISDTCETLGIQMNL